MRITSRPSPRLLAVASLMAVVATLLPGVTLAQPPGAGPPPEDCEERSNSTQHRLRECVGVGGAFEHLDALQRIAEEHGGNRASGTPGYEASVDYVVERLEAVGYDPTVQRFEFPFFEVLEQVLTIAGGEQTPVDLAEGTGTWHTMAFSGNGTITDATAVPTTDVVTDIEGTEANTSDSGCQAEDFTAPPEGSAVALVQRGSCPFLVKALNAQKAGYDAAIVFNEGQDGRREPLLGTLGADALGQVGIPVLGTDHATGARLIESPDLPVSITVDTLAEVRETANVLATLPGRSGDGVVMAGAHLDSVPEGPGVNDNGTGSAAILEVAEALAGTRTQRPVRFAWWGAEEFGLLGSTHYVESLDEEARARIGHYLNFDMIGSPNFVRFTYDGDQSTFEAPVPVPEGSAEIEAVFDQYYDAQGVAHEDSPFNGRSDYAPFIEAGIPSGGLFTGAEDVKTAEQVAAYGGVADLAYDPCYHQDCDDGVEPNAVAELEEAYGEDVLEGNVNRLVFGDNIGAVAYATLRFAQTGHALGVAAEDAARHLDGRSRGLRPSTSPEGGAPAP